MTIQCGIVLWVKGESVGMPVNQRVVLYQIWNEDFRVILLGTFESRTIRKDAIIGVELAEGIILRGKLVNTFSV